MIRLKCEACGSTDLKRSGYKYICDYCGSKYFFNEDDQEVDSELTDVRVLELLEESKKLHHTNKFVEELKVLNKAYDLDSNNSVIMIHLGRCYRLLKNSGRALEFYNKAIELDPTQGAAYTNMGAIYLLREDYEQAKKSYEKGIPLIDKSEFDYWIAYANYAIVVAQLGDKKKAEERGYKNGDNARKMAGIRKGFLSGLFG